MVSKKKKGLAIIKRPSGWLIDWHNIEANDFAIAEEVYIAGENKKRPDIVLYVNGIALGVIELNALPSMSLKASTRT